MPGENGDKYVTWRDLADKLDAVHKAIDEVKTGQSKQGEEIARIGATLSLWLKLGPALIAAAVYFGPDVASAAGKLIS